MIDFAQSCAHMVPGRWPIRHADYKDPALNVHNKFPDLPLADCKVITSCIEIKVAAFTQGVQIDLT